MCRWSLWALMSHEKSQTNGQKYRLGLVNSFTNVDRPSEREKESQPRYRQSLNQFTCRAIGKSGSLYVWRIALVKNISHLNKLIELKQFFVRDIVSMLPSAKIVSLHILTHKHFWRMVSISQSLAFIERQRVRFLCVCVVPYHSHHFFIPSQCSILAPKLYDCVFVHCIPLSFALCLFNALVMSHIKVSFKNTDYNAFASLKNHEFSLFRLVSLSLSVSL